MVSVRPRLFRNRLRRDSLPVPVEDIGDGDEGAAGDSEHLDKPMPGGVAGEDKHAEDDEDG